MSKPDPRIASATVTGGPSDLIGHALLDRGEDWTERLREAAQP